MAQDVEIGFDRPPSWRAALAADKLGRLGFARLVTKALQRVGPETGLVTSIEGAWGSGKTSTLAMIEALLRDEQTAPVVVHFNPWLIGDRDALLRQFLTKIAAAVEVADHAGNGKKVADQLKAYSKTFDLLKFIPGAETWASIIKGVLQAAGDAVGAVAENKSADIEARKDGVEKALKKFPLPVIIFVDDIDRLIPQEVFEMIRIVKAVGDLPNVGYVLAWDHSYVAQALGRVCTTPSGAGVDMRDIRSTSPRFQ